jgi:hypothetical protein
VWEFALLVIQGIKVGHEKVGAPDWRQACDSLAGKACSDVYFDVLRCKAQCLRTLPDLLVNSPDSVRNAKSIPLNHLGTRLKEGGLM